MKDAVPDEDLPGVAGQMKIGSGSYRRAAL
jgi:hypothetical protein